MKRSSPVAADLVIVGLFLIAVAAAGYASLYMQRERLPAAGLLWVAAGAFLVVVGAFVRAWRARRRPRR